MDKSDLSSLDVQLAHALLRITVLEHLLLQKGLISLDDVERTTQTLIAKIGKVILEKLDSSKNLDEFIAALANKDKN